MKLKQSPVIFNEECHTYTLEGKRLLGITGLIHSVLGLGVYPDASEHVKDFVIPRAGSRGTAIHHAIQTIDTIGAYEPLQTVHTRFGCQCRDNIAYEDIEWDVSQELDNYVAHQRDGGFQAVANELTVSDNDKWASQIDNVWLKSDTGGIWLVDTKSNNVRLYPTCGYFQDNYFQTSEDALKEYLSWQLSIYAELFESENPGLKVEGLACNWLRKDAAAFWIIDRKPGELVWKLLKTEYTINDDETVCYHSDASVFDIFYAGSQNVKDRQLEILSNDAVNYIGGLIEAYDELKAKIDEAKVSIRAAMEAHGIKSWDNNAFRAVIANDCERSTFDTTAFKKDHPDLYEKYIVKKRQKGSFTLKSNAK